MQNDASYNYTTLQCFLGWKMPGPEKKFSLAELLGTEAYTKIQELNSAAEREYFSNTATKSYTEIGQMFFEAAEMTFSAMQQITDQRARAFIIDELLLGIYDNAAAAFYRGWRDTPEVSAWLRSTLMVSSLRLGKDDTVLQGQIADVKRVYDEVTTDARLVASREDIARILLQEITKGEVDDRLALYVCDRLIQSFKDAFYSVEKKPKAQIVDIYRMAYDESIARAANLNTDDFTTRIKAHQTMQKRYENLIDKTALWQNISYAGESGKTALRKKRKPKQ